MVGEQQVHNRNTKSLEVAIHTDMNKTLLLLLLEDMQNPLEDVSQVDASL